MPDSVAGATPSIMADLLAYSLVALADPRVSPPTLSTTLARLLPGTRVDVLLHIHPAATVTPLVTGGPPGSGPAPVEAITDEAALVQWLRGRGYAAVEYIPVVDSGTRVGSLVLSTREDEIGASQRRIANHLAGALALRYVAARRENELRDARTKLLAATARAAATTELWHQATLAVGSVHNLGNSLALISGMAELMHEESSESMRRDLQQIANTAQDGRRIVKRILARSEARAAEEPNLTIASAVIQDVVTLTRPVWGRGDRIAIRLDVAPVPPARADPADIREVLVNLILNAVAAMPQGGDLTLRASAYSEEVLIEVVDTGVGIERENLAAIFEPSQTTRAEGRGLGLPISRIIVEQAGGRLTAESEPGRGATFTVVLPAAQTAESGRPSKQDQGSIPPWSTRSTRRS